MLREGEVRYHWTATQSTTPAYALPKYTFTGQYSYMDDPSTTTVTEGFGLMFYNARWYDPSLGRFAQADTIVPGGVQGLDRYAYVNNSPINYVDPSGHFTCSNNPNSGDYCPGRPSGSISSGNPKAPQTVVFITCGIAPLDSGQCNGGSSLNPYVQWAEEQGYGVKINDVDICGSSNPQAKKSVCADLMLSQMQGILNDDPNTNFILVGHSAGADATILATYNSIGTDIQDNIQKIIILGQSGTYIDPITNPSLDPNIIASINDLANSAEFQSAYGSNLVVGDIYADKSPNGITVGNYVPGPADHMALTTDMDFFRKILQAANLSCNINRCP